MKHILVIIYLKRGAFQRYGSEAVRCLKQPWNTSPRKHQFARSTSYKSGRLLSDAVMICAVSDPLPVFSNGEYHQHAAPAQEAFCHLPCRQPSGGFGEICHVHPERAHICRCIYFTTIPRRIQDKCITFVLLSCRSVKHRLHIAHQRAVKGRVEICEANTTRP